MRWHYCDPPLLWLFPAAFVVHVAEEHAFGFTEWARRAFRESRKVQHRLEGGEG